MTRTAATLPEAGVPTVAVEGKIAKTKLVKRSVYGRGRVGVLRQRVPA